MVQVGLETQPGSACLIDIGICQRNLWGRSLKNSAITKVKDVHWAFPLVWVREKWRVHPVKEYYTNISSVCVPNAGMETSSLGKNG